MFWFQVTFFFNITFFEQQSVIKYVVPGTLNDNVNKQLHLVMLLRSSYSEKILKMPLDYSKLNATWRSKSLFNNHVMWNHKMFWCSDKKEDLVKISSSYVRCLKLLLRQKDMGLAAGCSRWQYNLFSSRMTKGRISKDRNYFLITMTLMMIVSSTSYRYDIICTYFGYRRSLIWMYRHLAINIWIYTSIPKSPPPILKINNIVKWTLVQY